MNAPGPCRLGVCLVLIGVLFGCARTDDEPDEHDGYGGSRSCRACHERFYHLWESSHHGKAMQPYTAAFAAAYLTPQTNDMVIGPARYRADVEAGVVVETQGETRTTYTIEHVMGGKNVFFFLTRLDRGRLQVLPVSYHVERKAWFDTTASMVRHFGDTEEKDEAIDWRDPLLTFNTSCFNCHVSQLEKNYDPATDSYDTTWREPGISCETCHGPCGEHNRVLSEAPEGTVPDDLKVLSWKTLSVDQKNDACLVCHAKMRSITPVFSPGDRFFDHFDLVCLEDTDFYPDGRDLGENYTMTSWLMSPCAKNGKFDCLHCHTSSGRYRFKDKNHNDACLPCHRERVEQAEAHTHHKPGRPGSRCVECHMPTTVFSNMRRSDHSMRPPCPDAMRRYQSPDACTMCHAKQGVAWTSARIRKWHPDGRWQDRILREAELIHAARAMTWETLPEMLSYMDNPKADDIIVTSLIRLLAACPDERRVPVLLRCTKHQSPLVRAAAALALSGQGDIRAAAALVGLLQDDYRLVRIRAAAALAEFPRDWVPPSRRASLEKAEGERLTSITCRPDDWSSQYNLGNYRVQQGEAAKAMAAYRKAMALRPDVLLPYVNASILAAKMGQSRLAWDYLQKALAVAPDDGVVNFNIGLLLAERNDRAGAERHLRKAMKEASVAAPAAYNLAVLVGARDPAEAVALCRKALAADPDNEKYKQGLAYYLAR